MKAIVQERYGSAEVLQLQEVDTPTPAGNELLVRVYASAVNAADWHTMRGDPKFARLSTGLRAPKAKIRGHDFAGRVEAIGKDVKQFHPGDEVFGDLGFGGGGFAEYVRVPENYVESKPANLSFEEAAAIPLAGATALQGLRRAGVREGQHVLINGASGGVGTFAVQIAKALGAIVTAVVSTRNVDLVHSLGADHVRDYRREDFVRNGQRYDVIFDLVGNRSLSDLRRALKPTGTLVLSGGGVYNGGSLLGPIGLILRGSLLSRFVRQRVIVLSTVRSKEDLSELRQLAESGKVKPVLDRTYPLSQAPDAVRYLEQEHARAKVIITM
jgi:NADPH:quinone reductase-like Zn-dependent oxidoreductase